MTSSSSRPYGCLIIILLLVAAARMSGATATPSQFCDECAPKIHDITTTLSKKGIPTWGETALRNVMNETQLPETRLVFGNVVLGTHWASHVDSPAHYKPYFSSENLRADGLNLNTLIGPVMVVDTPRDSNITAAVLAALNLPQGLKRVIFRTANTDRRLKDEIAFVTDYTGLTADGASWLANNTAIDLVGIDYFSVGAEEEVISVHEVFFRKKKIIPVECLNLDQVAPGMYTVYCLPLKVHADGAPVRCILVE